MTQIGKAYKSNLERIENRVRFCLGLEKNKPNENLRIFIEPFNDSRKICYRCLEPIDVEGIKVVIMYREGLIKDELYFFHKFHYQK